MKIGLVSLGCARTLVDSEAALGGLKEEGYEIVRDVRRADIAIVNTCGFIDEAKRESIETILGLCELKKKGKLSAVVVLGCLAQRFGPEIRDEISEVDAIVGTNNYGDLAAVLAPLRAKKKVFEVKARPHYLVDENTPRVALTPEHTAYVKISEGCINACSYCVIPKMKGPHRSRTVESVVNEVRKLSGERRLSEVNLIGQDTAAFGFDRGRTFEIAPLLREVSRLGVPWVRLLYAHPGHVTEEMIAAMAESPAICRYVDFPIEHSHDAMLARMNRGVTRARMEWGMRELRKRMPGVAVRTTVIVGFPGETEEEFRDLMDFLKDARFERLGAFIFSREEGSRAFGLPDEIPHEVKEERFRAVMEQQKEISRELNEAFIGRTVRVLVDRKDPKERGIYYGRTEADAPEVDQEVEIRARAPLRPGDFIDVKITDALEYDLLGEPATSRAE
jgi:ribosomal protein S12 methylthiotransferase